MAYGDLEACNECLFGMDGASDTCDDCDMGECFVPAETDQLRDKKLNRYMKMEAA